jgi:hypothetical protein
MAVPPTATQAAKAALITANFESLFAGIPFFLLTFGFLEPKPRPRQASAFTADSSDPQQLEIKLFGIWRALVYCRRAVGKPMTGSV